ncbi:MAG: TolC family protein [Ferruginibacter sp.]
MKLIVTIFLSLIACNSFAQQKTFTLKECIETAIGANLDVAQAAYQKEVSGIDAKQAKQNLLPNFNASIGHSANQGRSIDPSSNSYVVQKFSSANYGLNGDVVLFRGLTLQQLIRQKNYGRQASEYEWQQQKDNITLNTILTYLQLMNTQDMLALAQAQEELSKQQEARLKILDEKGAIAPAIRFDVQGQLAGDHISVTNLLADLESAKISLCRLMNMPYQKGLSFERINADTIASIYETEPAAAFNEAIKKFSRIKAAEMRLQSAKAAINVARGSLFPTLGFGTGLYSNYSSAAQKGYGSQLKNNYSSAFALSLNIPIFNSFAARNNIKLAKANYRYTEQLNNAVKNTLQQDVEEAHINMTAAFERYRSLIDQVNAYQKSFEAAEAKFSAGVGNSIDYLTVKNNLYRANNNLIAAKYDYILRTKILDYYQGKQLW